jgi:imidazolonepropionase-like amidohydrolase
MHKARIPAPEVMNASDATSPSIEPAPPPLVLVRSARLLDVQQGEYLRNAEVLVEGDRIKEVGSPVKSVSKSSGNLRVVDLGNLVLLPGLIDCHTHLMARVPAGSDSYRLNLLTKSEAFRALEGAANAKAVLGAGFTTVRDVESEGAGYSDVALRDAINQGLVEGPRMLVATRGIAAVGQYHPFGISSNLVGFPTGAQMVSGLEEARRAVREQVGHGADLIKVYADWDTPTLTLEELRVIVEEAHKLGRKVAAHATTPEGIQNAVTAGADSIEHGTMASVQNLELMKSRGVYLVPTVGGLEAYIARTLSAEASARAQAAYQGAKESLRRAKELGVRIANGFDATDPESQGRNADELMVMTKFGLSPLEALRAATVTAAELLTWQDRVGSLEPGKFADLIGVEGDPLVNIEDLRTVPFVMKGGMVMKGAQPPP